MSLWAPGMECLVEIGKSTLKAAAHSLNNVDVTLALSSSSSAGSAASSAASTGSAVSEVPAAHFEPQVAVMCEPRVTYHNQYMTEAGHWVSDPDTKAACPRDKMAVLEYCKKVCHTNFVM
ncbi:hypothetical protein B566_EDAN011995 [Ephemera danica]|nr:hypothetical protein B566_EDAN011995 [Ephemera danica]